MVFKRIIIPDFPDFPDFYLSRCGNKTRACGVILKLFSQSYIDKRMNKQRSGIVAMFLIEFLSQRILQIYEGKKITRKMKVDFYQLFTNFSLWILFPTTCFWKKTLVLLFRKQSKVHIYILFGTKTLFFKWVNWHSGKSGKSGGKSKKIFWGILKKKKIPKSLIMSAYDSAVHFSIAQAHHGEQG